MWIEEEASRSQSDTDEQETRETSADEETARHSDNDNQLDNSRDTEGAALPVSSTEFGENDENTS